MPETGMTLHVQYNRIPEIVAGLDHAAALALDTALANVEQQAKVNCPVLTGALRSSGFRITPVYDGYATAVQAMQSINPRAEASMPPAVGPAAGVVGFAASYAQFVHDGHMSRGGNFVPGQPFLADAATALEDETLAALERQIATLAAGRASTFGPSSAGSWDMSGG